MAGRGTDILLGGNPEFMAKNVIKQKLKPDDPGYQEEYRKLLEKYKKETTEEHEKVVKLGGLHVLGTERHESRRIDNQLRGRSGRQGDPGSSRFYVALEDDLMRLFGSERLVGLMEKLGLEKGQVIEHPWVAGSIEIAQRRVEQHNFEIRKQLLDYDNVMNKQREIIYSQRKQTLEGANLKENMLDMLQGAIDNIVELYMGNKHEPDLPGLVNIIKLKFGFAVEDNKFDGLDNAQLKDRIYEVALASYEQKEGSVGEDLMHHLERMVFLQIIDSKWKDHLYAMDSLREGIGLRAYGQRDPLIEYKREGFLMFNQMIASIEEEAVETLFKLQPAKPAHFKGVFSERKQELTHSEASALNAPDEQVEQPKHKPTQSTHPKVGRNEPCPCGSQKKYKKCCGR
jgi:preprotein translocase subunit SecA